MTAAVCSAGQMSGAVLSAREHGVRTVTRDIQDINDSYFNINTVDDLNDTIGLPEGRQCGFAALFLRAPAGLTRF